MVTWQFLALIFGIGASWGSLITRVKAHGKDIKEIKNSISIINEETGHVKERLSRIEGIISEDVGLTE